MKKITKVFRNILWLISTICVISAIFKIYESYSNSKSNPYLHEIRLFDIKVSPEKIFQNVKGRFEYYVTFHHGEDTDLKALYCFDVKVCADLKKQHEDADTIVLPYPYVVADQSDDMPYTSLFEKGSGINFNDVYQPVKIALQKMAADYAKRNLLQSGADKMLEYFGSHYHRPFSIDQSGKERERVIDVQGLPIQFDYFESQMDDHQYSFEFDDVFNRHFGVKDVNSKKLVCTIGLYDTHQTWTFDTANDSLQKEFNSGYVRIINPTDPKGTICYIGKDKAAIVCGGYMYYAECCVENMEEYLPDIIYLLNSIKQCDESSSNEYLEWIGMYDDCIKYINDRNLSDAEITLKRMQELQKGQLSYSEIFLGALVKMLLGDRSFICETGNEEFDNLVNLGWSDLVLNNGEKLKCDVGLVDTLLDCVKNDCLKDMIKHYCIRHDVVQKATKKQYEEDLKKSGNIVDRDIISHSDKKRFLQYIENALRVSMSEERGESNLRILSSLNYPDCEVILDLMNSEGENIDADSYGSADSIIDDIRKSVHINEDAPQVIYVFSTKGGMFGRYKNNVVIFTRTKMIYIESFDKKPVVASADYQDVYITNKEIKFKQAKYSSINNNVLIKFLKNIQFSYMSPDKQDERFLDEIKNRIIQLTNYMVVTVPRKDFPIKLKY